MILRLYALFTVLFLKENLDFYIGKYLTWSSYEPEDDGVLVACASIHGNTKAAAEKMVDILKENGFAKVAFTDLTRDDMAEAIEDSFRYSRLIVAAASYDGGVFLLWRTSSTDFHTRLTRTVRLELLKMVHGHLLPASG